MAQWLASGLPPITPGFISVVCDFSPELDNFTGVAGAALVKVPDTIPNVGIQQLDLDVAAVLRHFWPRLVRRAVEIRHGVFMGMCAYEYQPGGAGPDRRGYEIEVLAHNQDPRHLMIGIDAALLQAFHENEFLVALDGLLLDNGIQQALANAQEFVGTAVREEAVAGSGVPLLIALGIVFGSALLIAARERTTIPISLL